MANLKYKTRGNSSPQGKPRVYFCCHPDDFGKYFELISNEILEKQNCAIWYSDASVILDEDFFDNLKQMQLIVMPITTNLLYTENEALGVVFKFATENHTPVLPLMQEQGLVKLFNSKCGDIQYLDKTDYDITAISYDEKLKKYLESVLIGDELAEKIRAAFDAYVFLSYRKKDRKYARELMRLIHNNESCRDIAIWYDEFLVPGEDFNESIKNALQKSELFVLAVTPNIVDETNYIMTIEYPMALQEEKPIFPAELIPTDRAQLIRKYENLPSPIDVYNKSLFSETLVTAVNKITIKKKDISPVHNFLIGLAYLHGIDVEVDYKKAISLITLAADESLPEAIQTLVRIYHDGSITKKDINKALELQHQLISVSEEKYRSSGLLSDFMFWMENLLLLGDFHYENGQVEESKDFYARIISEIGDSDDSLEIESSEVKLFVATVLLHLGNAEDEVDLKQQFYIGGLDATNYVSESSFELGAKKIQIALYNSIGDIYYQKHDLYSARDWYSKGIEIAEDVINLAKDEEAKLGVAQLYEDLGDVFENIDPYYNRGRHLAINYYNSSIKLLQEVITEYASVVAYESSIRIYENLSALYLDQYVVTKYLSYRQEAHKCLTLALDMMNNLDMSCSNNIEHYDQIRRELLKFSDEPPVV